MSATEEALKEGETLVADIPVEHCNQFGTDRIGSVIITDQRTIFLYRTNGSWEKFAEHSLSSEPFAQYRDDELYAVFIPEPDHDQISQSKSEFITKVEDVTGASYFIDVLSEHSQKPDFDPADCSCERMSSNKVLVESENAELGEHFDQEQFRLVSCESCYKIYGRYRRGKKASLKKLLSADWLLGGESTSESIVELGKEDAFAIHHPPDGSTRVQDAILTLSHIASRSNDIVSTYKHDYQHALCYIEEDRMAGYLSWEDHDQGPIQSQLYVRNKQRGKGIAGALISGWYAEVCESEHYYADELAEGGRAVLDSVNHLEGNSPPAREVHSLTPMTFG